MMAGGYRRKVIPVTTMDCPTCVVTIERELARLEGVRDVRVNFLMRKIVVDYDPERIGVPELEERVEGLGYRISYKKYEGLFDRISRALRMGRREEGDGFRRVDDHNFEELVLQSNRPVIVLFASPQCPTCKLMRPRLGEVARKFEDRIYVYELNVMETHRWEDHDVMSVPTLLYFDDGREVGRLVGLAGKDEVEMRVLELFQT